MTILMEEEKGRRIELVLRAVVYQEALKQTEVEVRK